MLKPDSGSRRKLVPLRDATERDGIVLEPPRLESLTAAQEAEAVELLAELLAAAARHRPREGRGLRRAA